MGRLAQKTHPSLNIGSRKIGLDYPCFIVAELSANHHQNFDEAVELIKAAAKSGADAVKLQTYTPDTLTLDAKNDWFLVQGVDIPKLWRGKYLYDLYKTAYTPWDWYPKLKKIAEMHKLIIFSAPFDITAVDFLEEHDAPCYKIASYEAMDVQLIRRVAKTNKPVIISEGFFDVNDVGFSLKTLRGAGAKDIIALHCVSQYSGKSNPGVVNLRNIVDLRERFDVISGFSDNNAGIDIPILAAAMGAAVVEKHFILSRKSGGLDSRFSIEPAELAKMVSRIRKNEELMGIVHYGPGDDQAGEIIQFVRSLFASRDIREGETLTPENVRSLRPGIGLSPKYWDEVIGQKAKKDISLGTPLNWKHIMGVNKNAIKKSIKNN